MYQDAVLAKGLYTRVTKCKIQHWPLSTTHGISNFSEICTYDFFYSPLFLTQLVLQWQDTSCIIYYLFYSPLFPLHLLLQWLDTSCSIMSMTIPASLSFHWTPHTLWTVYLQVQSTPSQCQLWVMLGQAKTIHQFSLVSLIGHALPIWVYFSTLWMQLFHHYFVKL